MFLSIYIYIYLYIICLLSVSFRDGISMYICIHTNPEGYGGSCPVYAGEKVANSKIRKQYKTRFERYRKSSDIYSYEIPCQFPNKLRYKIVRKEKNSIWFLCRWNWRIAVTMQHNSRYVNHKCWFRFTSLINRVLTCPNNLLHDK